MSAKDTSVYFDPTSCWPNPKPTNL
ncbi:hypothetical protein CCACVL1_24371 [Corchorus capsularis]|uniref:Uncharacterized protein n=1 Tax=Corchorus capsularis TaxID=210143 RepID=A0A1R3GQ20_COCAP|nr:hypothetical protein CCACVL1_24371 [Corchorus capsularis]